MFQSPLKQKTGLFILLLQRTVSTRQLLVHVAAKILMKRHSCTYNLRPAAPGATPEDMTPVTN
ncbi:hypothetical protein AHX05_09960 [Salmonella enterica subsp. indica]|nr:hypothetical protein [Salmonella enterica subsp. indica]